MTQTTFWRYAMIGAGVAAGVLVVSLIVKAV